MLMTVRAALVALAVALFGGACTQSPDSPTSSSDGTAADSIASAAPGTDVYLVPLRRSEAGQLQVGTPTNVTQRPGYDNQPAFVQEGGALLFSSVRGDQTDVYRYDVAADSVSQVTLTTQSEYSPTPRPNDMMTVVRVETDGRQRLWEYTMDGAPEALVLPALDSVGYHAWVDEEHVALFVLGDPPTLQYATVATGNRDTMATRIGRSLQRIPGERAVSFVKVAEDSTTSIHALHAGPTSVRQLTATPGSQRGVDHAWMPDGTLLMADSTRLYAWGMEEQQWATVADLAPLEPSRLAVSPDGRTLALVASDQ